MGTFKFDVDGANVAPASGGVAYDGPPPKKGIPYRCKLKRMQIKTNKNDEPMLNFVCEISEPAKKAGKTNPNAECNGYGMWANLNVTDQGAPYVNQFLTALAGPKAAQVIKDFWGPGPRIDDDKSDAPKVVGIGRFKIEDGLDIIVQGKFGKGQYAEELKADRFYSSSELKGGAAEDTDEEEEYAEDEEVEAEEEVDEEFAEREEELDAMARPALSKIARELGIKVLKSKSNDDLVSEILTAEFPDDEDEEEPEEDEPEEEEPEPEPEPVKAVRARRAPARGARGKGKPPY